MIFAIIKLCSDVKMENPIVEFMLICSINGIDDYSLKSTLLNPLAYIKWPLLDSESLEENSCHVLEFLTYPLMSLFKISLRNSY